MTPDFLESEQHQLVLLGHSPILPTETSPEFINLLTTSKPLDFVYYIHSFYHIKGILQGIVVQCYSTTL